MQAVADFDRAISIDPSRFELFLYRGMARHRLKHHEEALEDFNQAASLNPESPRVMTNRGSLLAHLDRADEAITDFTAAIELNPGTADAWYGRGLLGVRLAEGDKVMTEQAHSDLKQAIVLDPNNAQLDAAMSILQPAETQVKKRRY